MQEALEWFRRAADLNPKFAEAHYLCGVAQDQMSQIQQALDSYKTSARLSPGDPRAWTAAGVCLIRLRQFPAAINALREAVRLKPHYGGASVHLWLAEALMRNKQIRLACEEWRIITHLEPSYPDYDGPMKEARELLNRYCGGTDTGNLKRHNKRV